VSNLVLVRSSVGDMILGKFRSPKELAIKMMRSEHRLLKLACVDIFSPAKIGNKTFHVH
jgi:hypothetical protein